MYPSIRLYRALWIVNQDYQNKMLKGRRQNDANTETATLVHSNRRNNSEAYWKRNEFFMYWNYVEINHVAKMSLGWKSHIAQGRWIIKKKHKKIKPKKKLNKKPNRETNAKSQKTFNIFAIEPWMVQWTWTVYYWFCFFASNKRCACVMEFIIGIFYLFGSFFSITKHTLFILARSPDNTPH